MTSGIYIISFDNGRKYVGLSVDIEQRWRHHKSNLINNKYPTVPLYHAMRTHHYVVGIVEECERDMLQERERYYIDFYNTMIDENGYNYRDGGAVNTGWTGKRNTRVLTEEHKRRISEKMKGRKNSDEYKRQHSERMKEYYSKNMSSWDKHKKTNANKED